MQHETTQAPCAAPSLQQVIQRLKDEKAQVNAALGKALVSEWETPGIRALGNREQELHIALDVLEKLEPQPMQIAEPAATTQAVQPAVMDDYVLVPVVATEDMKQAAADYLGVCVKGRGLWEAILAAAPACERLKKEGV